MVDKILRFEDYEGQRGLEEAGAGGADDEYKFGASTPGNLCYAGERTSCGRCDKRRDERGQRDCRGGHGPSTTSSAAWPPTSREALRPLVVLHQHHDHPEFHAANCTPALVSLLNESALLVNYQGHANRDRFTHESLILDGGNPTNPTAWTDIRGLTNAERPFIFAATLLDLGIRTPGRALSAGRHR